MVILLPNKSLFDLDIEFKRENSFYPQEPGPSRRVRAEPRFPLEVALRLVGSTAWVDIKPTCLPTCQQFYTAITTEDLYNTQCQNRTWKPHSTIAVTDCDWNQ